MNQIKQAKCFYSISLLSALSPFVAMGTHSLTDLMLLAQSPLHSSIQVAEQPICYMQTSNGKLLDLSHLCNRLSERAQVVVSGTIRQDNLLLGNVVNRSGRAVWNVRVNYEAIAPNGRVINRGIARANPRNLNPGQMGTFEVDVVPGSNIRTANVLWDE